MLITFSLLLFASICLMYLGKLALIVHKTTLAHGEVLAEPLYIIEQLSVRANIKIPELHIIHESNYNAFSTRYGNKNAIAITQNLTQLLTHEELKGVLAHEIAHIHLHQHFIQRVNLLALQVIQLTIYQCQRLVACCLKGQSHPIRHLTVQVLRSTLSQLTRNRYFQAKEFQADAFGAKLCGSPIHLATALQKIDQANHQQGIQDIHTWDSSHPPVSERIRRLEAIRFGAYI